MPTAIGVVARVAVAVMPSGPVRVPQAGDRREDFGYNGTYDPHYVGDVPWDEFVQSAVEATRDAENDAQAWRDVQAWRETRA